MAHLCAGFGSHCLCLPRSLRRREGSACRSGSPPPRISHPVASIAFIVRALGSHPQAMAPTWCARIAGGIPGVPFVQRHDMIREYHRTRHETFHPLPPRCFEHRFYGAESLHPPKRNEGWRWQRNLASTMRGESRRSPQPWLPSDRSSMSRSAQCIRHIVPLHVQRSSNIIRAE